MKAPPKIKVHGHVYIAAPETTHVEGHLLRHAANYALPESKMDGKDRPLTPIERELQSLKYYTRRGRSLPEIPKEEKDRIDYYIAARNNETEPSIPQMVQQITVDFLEVPPTNLMTVGGKWGGYLRPLLAYAFNKLIDTGKYTREEVLKSHPNGIAVSAVLQPLVSSVEIGYRKTANVVTAGTYFLKWGTVPLVVSFDFEGQVAVISCTVSEENKSVGEVFLQDFARSVAANNIYKNQKLAMVDGALRFIDIEPIKMGDVFLPKKIRHSVVENTVGVLQSREALLGTPGGLNRSIILAGKPGTGKTQLFKAVANAAENTTVILVSSKAFQYPSDVATLYSAARDLGPTLLILEDMDLIGSKRTYETKGAQNELLGEFLTQMSGAEANDEIITVASTNNLAAIDEALANRPGRFDRVIPVPLPNKKYRWRMLKAFLNNLGIDLKVSKATALSVLEQTEGMTGAYIKEIARTLHIKSVVGKKVASTGPRTATDNELLVATKLVHENFMASRQAALADKEEATK